jgi:6,7-dimethyl-8-ribityllumazine synthase
MSSAHKNLSEYDSSEISSCENMRFGIVVSTWNHKITESLYDAAVKTLLSFGAKKENLIRKNVPGSYELCLGAQFFAEYADVDAVICLGCVIQGETRHFDFICDAVAQGLMTLNLKYNKPFVFGLLTPGNMQQALDRAGGIHGNKGDEAAITAIQMLTLQFSFLNR